MLAYSNLAREIILILLAHHKELSKRLTKTKYRKLSPIIKSSSEGKNRTELFLNSNGISSSMMIPIIMQMG